MHTSVAVRLPDIARRVMRENALPSAARDSVSRLIHEIGAGVIRPLADPAAPDAAAWAGYVEPHLGVGWLDVPWFFAETYFYRRIMEAVGYHAAGHGVDPFREQKRLGLAEALGAAEALGVRLDDLPALVGASLWANQVDLSLWPAGEAAAAARAADVISRRDQRILADDRAALSAALATGPGLLHLVLDNAGAELVADLALVAGLVRRGWRVAVHAKAHPTFVSDATIHDVDEAVARLEERPEGAGRIGAEVRRAIGDRRITVGAHPYWVSPLAGWEMPPDLVGGLATADLVVVKGDANHRRLLGDRHWRVTTPFAAVVRPPVPLASLRTLKSEIAVGLGEDVVARAAAADPDWMIDGEWGVVQWAPGAPSGGGLRP